MSGAISVNGAQFVLSKPKGRVRICGAEYKYKIISGVLTLTRGGARHVFMSYDGLCIEGVNVWWQAEI